MDPVPSLQSNRGVGGAGRCICLPCCYVHGVQRAKSPPATPLSTFRTWGTGQSSPWGHAMWAVWLLVPAVAALPCEERQAWQQIQQQLRQMLPRYSGRLSFVHIQEDVPMATALHKNVMNLSVPPVLLQPQVPIPWEGEWSFCHSGLLSVKLFLVMLGITGKSAHAADLSAALAAEVLKAPWLEILGSGWPVFRLFATLHRWASPHMDPKGAEISPHGRAALASASAMVSHCDAAEAGAARQARRGFAAGDGDTAEVEEAFALREKKMEKDCFWTVHVNRSLGGHLGELEASQAFASCAARPDCAGVMLSSSAGSLRLGEPLLESAPGLEAHVRWCLPWVATEGTEGGAGALCPFAPTVGLLGTALRRLGNGRTMEKFAPELVAQANLEVSTFSAQFGAGAAGREAWSTQWPLWKVLGQLQQRLDLLTDPIGASPGTTVLPALQHALGFDDEAWLVLLRELEESSKQAKLPTSLRERVKCMSGSSCAAEFFARLHLMLYSSDSLPLRDQIFMNNEDPLLPELMLNSKRKDFNDVKELEYDWKAIVDDVRNNRHETGETSRIDAMKALMPIDHPLQVDRMQLANFILEVKDEIVASGPMTRCLEWDQPFLLAHAFAAHCRWMDVYSYSEPHPSEPRLGLPGRQEFPSGTIHYWGDMEVPENFGVDPGTMDLILCPFVFEHVSRPWVAMRTLADSLRPGGFILWAAPMFQRYHGSPHDYYRYTPNGAKALATHAGLEVVRLYSPGDLSLVSGAPALAPR
ncbi:unnamed protein product, partial [Effrenium voratum]